jgi:hypothetical protein
VVEGVALLVTDVLEVLVAAQNIHEAHCALGLPETDGRPVIAQPPGRLDDGFSGLYLEVDAKRLNAHNRSPRLDLFSCSQHGISIPEALCMEIARNTSTLSAARTLTWLSVALPPSNSDHHAKGNGYARRRSAQHR